jgi:hypothetical protein
MKELDTVAMTDKDVRNWRLATAASPRGTQDGHRLIVSKRARCRRKAHTTTGHHATSCPGLHEAATLHCIATAGDANKHTLRKIEHTGGAVASCTYAARLKVNVDHRLGHQRTQSGQPSQRRSHWDGVQAAARCGSLHGLGRAHALSPAGPQQRPRQLWCVRHTRLQRRLRQ